MNVAVEPGLKRIGPVVLAAGIRPRDVAVYLGATMCAAFVVVFAETMQPVILNQQLHVPIAKQGLVTGALGTTQQAAVLLFIGFAGVLADKLGRRLVLTIALLGFAAGLVAYPFLSSVAGLFVLRFVWGAFSSGHTAGGATKLMDYPDETSRGKFLSLITLIYAAAVAAFVGLVGSKLPSWLRSGGLSSAEATRYAFWIISLVGLAGAYIAFRFMGKDAVAQPAGASARPRRGLGQIVDAWRQVFAHAAKHPRFAATLLIAVVIRTDIAIMIGFLGLWVVQAGRQHGIDPIQATKTVGLLVSLRLVANLVSTPLFGWLSDRVDRLAMMITCLAVTGAAFGAFGLIKDVFSGWMMAAALFVGMAEGAQALSANALMGEVAPLHLRGSSLGIFTWIGVSSVLVVNVLAGALYDRIGPAAPFVLESGLCFLVFLAAVALVIRSGAGRAPGAEPLRPIS